MDNDARERILDGDTRGEISGQWYRIVDCSTGRERIVDCGIGRERIIENGTGKKNSGLWPGEMIVETGKREENSGQWHRGRE